MILTLVGILIGILVTFGVSECKSKLFQQCYVILVKYLQRKQSSDDVPEQFITEVMYTDKHCYNSNIIMYKDI